MSAATMGIGEFARATHLTIKTLRHYDHVGLLEPAAVDSGSGYRRYSPEQLGRALLISRFRALDMRLDDIRQVLDTPDLDTRNAVITAHLDRMEVSLARTQTAVGSLRDLLVGDLPGGGVRRMSAPRTAAIAIRAEISVEDGSAGPWLQGALIELQATLARQGAAATGAAGGIFDDEIFTEGRGAATIFIPTSDRVRPAGRAHPAELSAAEYATIVHVGSHQTIDRSYAALAAHVSQHALAVPGPVRENYIVGVAQTVDEREWRTQVAWPIFRTGG